MPNLNRTVLLKGQLGEKREEARAAEAISPGHLLELLSNGKIQKNDKVAGNIQILVALEDPYQSRTVDVDYAIDDLVSYHVAKPGDKVYLRIAAGAGALVYGDSVEPIANGLVQKLAAGVRIGIVELAIDNSGGATVEWVQVRIV